MKMIEINYGDKYNQLTILKEDEPYWDRKTGNRVRMVHCRCDCDNEVIIRLYDLRGGRIKTCGCSKKKGGPKTPL